MFSGLRTSVLLAVSTLLMATAPTTSLLRKDISTAIVLATGTENRNLASLAGGKPHALLLISPSLPLELCTAVSSEIKRVRGFGLEVTLIWTTPGKNSCGSVPAYTLSTQLKELMAIGQMPTSGGRAVVLDGDGVVRLDENLDASRTELKAAADKLIAWNQGRQSFSVHCGHCHDDDGANTSYVGIKTLVGISTRVSDKKITEGGEMFGAVPIYTWKKSEVDSLLLFIRGL